MKLGAIIPSAITLWQKHIMEAYVYIAQNSTG